MMENKPLVTSGSPEFIYQLIQKKWADPNIIEINKNIPDLPLTLDGDFKKLEVSIQQKIKQIRSQDFTYRYISESGEEILIKDLTNTSDSSLNPMHKREAEIQALRYLHGILIILENSSSLNKNTRNHFYQSYNTYLKKMSLTPQDAVNHTHWLAEEFAKLLVDDDVDMDHARRQITMARDLGTQLETHPAICTISKNGDPITIEKSSQIKISNEFYHQHFSSIHAQPWFHNALSYAGFSSSEPNTWLENFFIGNMNNLKKLGVPASPSARWLPLPASNQLVENHVINPATQESFSTNFIRMGTIAAYGINNTFIQEKLAFAQLKEIIKPQLVSHIKHFKNKYSEIIPAKKFVNFDFYVDYQSLLTTHYLESAFPHTDNNSKFYKLTKKTMAALANDQELKALAAEQGANLIFYHTNLSINKHADWISARKSSQRITDIQNTKITVTEDLLKNIDKEMWKASNNKNIKAEIALRITASTYLKAMLLSPDTPSPLKHYQRHIMMAALEFLVMGDQALALAGCKSARDRTLVFAAAVKTMQENPTAMHDWKVLSAGIIKSIMQGHHFRSMSHHVAAVKINLVHSEFMSKLPASLQSDINLTKKFTNTLKKYAKQIKTHHETEILLSHYSGTLFSTKPINVKIELPEQRTPKLERYKLS